MDFLRCTVIVISIHAPREGGDNANAKRISNRLRFQSTPPARGATAYLGSETT